MNNKIIEKYIQFAIENGFTINKEALTKFPVSELIYPKEIYTENEYLLDSPRENIDGILVIGFNILIGDFAYKGFKSVCEIITSKEFIEAIARGLWGLEDEIELTFDNVTRTYNKYDGDMYDDGSLGEIEEIVIKEITHNQADAIRDGKLEEFITNLGILGQEKKG